LAALSPPEGRPVAVAPWRVALVMVMQSLAGLTDRQAAEAVRRCMDWQDALSLDLHAPGFACTLWHDGRQRFLAHEAGQRCLATFLATCQARGWSKARGPQRPDAPPILAAIRPLQRVACVLEAMHDALPQHSAADPAWVQQHGPPAWDTRYGLRSDQTRLPTDPSQREALARQSGADGSQLLDGVWAAASTPYGRALPALEALRQSGLHHYDRCTVPGLADLRWRTAAEQPPAARRLTAPYASAARSGTKRDTPWVGSKLHRSETGEPEPPDLRTPVLTTPATTPDWTLGPPMVQDVAARDLLPGTPLCDRGSVAADFLVTAQQQSQIDVVGPPDGASSWHHKMAHGDDVQAFILDWDAHQAHCLHGHTSGKWTPGHDVSGAPVCRRRFDRAPCRACPTRPGCTAATDAPRQRTVRPQAHHEARQAARQRQETPECKEKYALRSGVESSLSQGIRRFALRQSRYRGLAGAHLQQLLTATAMHVVRVSAW
jgi:transposase